MGALNRKGAGGGGLFYVAKMMVSILQNGVERKVETLRQMKLDVMQGKNTEEPLLGPVGVA